MQVAEQQMEGGNLFMFEHPQSARFWEDRRVQKVMRRSKVGTIVFDQCMFGLSDVQGGDLDRKRARVMSNSEHVLSELGRTGSKDHRHQHLLGKVKHEGVWQSRSKL